MVLVHSMSSPIHLLSLWQPFIHKHRFEAMNRLIAAQRIKPVIDSVYRFEDSLLAYKYLKSQKHVGKVVIQVTSESG